MSYTGDIVAVPMFAASVIAEYTLGGIVNVMKKVGKKAFFGVDLVRSAVQTAVIHHMQGDLKNMMGEALTLNDELAQNMQAMVGQCYSDYEKTLERLKENFDKSTDMTAFLQECQNAQQILHENIQQKRHELETGTIHQIRHQLQIVQSEMQHHRRTIETSIQQISDDMERKSKTKEFTLSQIEEATAMIEDFRNSGFNCEIAKNALSICEATLQKANQFLEEGLFESALVTAYSAKDALLLKVSEMMETECRNRQLYADTKATLDTLKELMQEQKSISYPFHETRNGKPIIKEVADFNIYYRGEWEQIQQKLTRYEAQLSGADFRDYLPENLQDIWNHLSELQNHFLHETEIAYERLHNELLRMETGKLLYKRYQSLGYELLPMTEAEKNVSTLDSLIMHFRHSETGEEISLQFNAVPDADGHITMNIQMQDHTHYEGSNDDIEQARIQARAENCNAIQNTSIGKNLRLQQRCLNPDVLDTWQSF